MREQATPPCDRFDSTSRASAIRLAQITMTYLRASLPLLALALAVACTDGGGTVDGSGGSNTGGAHTGGSPSDGASSGGSSGGTESTGGDGSSPTGGSGGSSEPVPSAGVSTVAEFCALYPAAMAAYHAACDGGSVDDWLGATPDCGAAVRSEAAGRVSLNVEQADVCLHGLTGGECRGFSCSAVLLGTIPEDGTCNNLRTSLGDECAPGLFCPASRHDTCTHSCSLPDLLPEGGNCGGQFNYADCPLPMQCDSEALCNLPLGEGESCAGNGDCASGLYCLLVGEAGTCEPRPAGVGDPCTSNNECQAGLCRGEEGAQACALPKQVGDSCTFGENECAQQCSLDGVCEVASQEGEPCGQIGEIASGSEYLSCASDLFCETESSTCQPRLELGVSCVGVESLGEPCELSDQGLTECPMGACVLCEWME
jgi:hypothetical protein